MVARGPSGLTTTVVNHLGARGNNLEGAHRARHVQMSLPATTLATTVNAVGLHDGWRFPPIGPWLGPGRNTMHIPCTCCTAKHGIVRAMYGSYVHNIVHLSVVKCTVPCDICCA